MPTPDQLQSLLALQGGRANVANSRGALRNTQVNDPRTTDAFRRLVMGENAQEAQQFEDDPQSQGYEDIAQGQAAAHTDQDPMIAGLRERDLADKERLLTAPARTAGEYNVRAAQAAGKARGEAAAQTQQGMVDRADAAREAAMERARVTQQGQNQRQQTALAAKTKASGGLLSGIKSLFGMGQPEAAPTAMPAAGTGDLVAMHAPDGRELHVPSDRVAELQALGATLD